MSPTSKTNITVRMYKVGFGDAFLILVPTPDGGTRKVLVDCGIHSSSVNPPPMTAVVSQIIKDVTDSDGVPRVDVVIATHRHQDHVRGFENKAWQQVQVQEVWMPWTEHPKEDKAKRLREAQSTAAQSFAVMSTSQLATLSPEERERMETAMVLASNSLVNHKAMATLHSGFSKKKPFGLRRYLPEKEGGDTFQTGALPGVKIHVLGPSRDVRVITAKDDENDLYKLLRGVDGGSDNVFLSLPSPLALTPQQFNRKYSHLALESSSRKAIRQAGQLDRFAAAAALEYSVNNTSLVLLLEIGGNFLLFPGDAQWSTWNMIIQSPWRELLAETTFLKLGHHGSNNASPISFVRDVLKQNFWVFVSTGPTKQWTKTIPRPNLLKQLRRKPSKVIRSDIQDVPDPQAPNLRRVKVNASVKTVEIDLPL